MKYSLLALPALLRPAIFLVSASQHAFSVNDDVFAFPQYEVRFKDDYLTDLQAQVKLSEQAGDLPDETASGQVGKFQSAHDTQERSNNDDDEEKVEYTHMVLNGQRYLCSVPQVRKPERREPNATETVTKAERELELTRAADRGWELLRGMQGTCVYYVSGWWSYRFCYNDGVRQFHQLPPSKTVPIYPPVEDPSVEGFMLGTYKPSVDDDETEHTNDPGTGELVQRGDSRYLVQRLDGGTKCDLTGKARRIEVQYHCNPMSADKITMIKEVSTCAYMMVVQTARLCDDVAFQPPEKDLPNVISCHQVVREDEIARYEQELYEVRAAEKEAQIWAANTDAAQVFLGVEEEKLRVGDVILGGHNMVPEDVKLEKSAVVGGGKVTFIDTIASSEGKMVSKETIEKLGLGDVKAIERLTERIEKLAGGKGWKLNVVDTPQGMEYRVILDATEDGDEASAQEGKKGAKSGADKATKPDDKKVKPKKKKKEPPSNDEEKVEGSQEEYFKDEL